MDVGDLVWIKNSHGRQLLENASNPGNILWLPGKIFRKNNEESGEITFSVVLDDYDCMKFEIRNDPVDIVTRSPSHFQIEVDNLLELQYLNEAEIINVLKSRNIKDNIYTYTGTVLIAINPFRDISGLYSDELLLKFAKDENYDKPHIWSVAKNTYKSLKHALSKSSDADKNSYSILVSGESGAGKTESSKYLLKYLIQVSAETSPLKASPEKKSYNKNGNDASIMEKILLSNPILEAFGNSKTMRNNNSSRFGKYVNLRFNTNGMITGGIINTYLLENVRVINQQIGERNFHIFYQLLAGATPAEIKKYKLKTADFYNYTYQGKVKEIENINDKHDYKSLKDCFSKLNITATTVSLICDIIAGILQIGQINFSSVVDEVSSEVASVVKDIHWLESAAILCGFSAKDLEEAMTIRTVISRGEEIKKRLNITQSTNTRDAICKTIYRNLFDWVVATINNNINSECNQSQIGATVGILDIFGFECFEKNSFEQLCINYANESLQQQFNMYVFKKELVEYQKEEIYFPSSNFHDNIDSLELIGSNIFKLLDDQCKLPNSSDAKFASQLYKELINKPKFSASSSQQRNSQFCILHFAGNVIYSTEGFIDKNSDELPRDITLILQNSKNSILSSSLASNNDQYTPPPTGKVLNTRKIAKSVSLQFKQQLNGLLNHLGTTTPYYIRCIKPYDTHNKSVGNELKVFNEVRVAEQLHNGGVFESIRVAKTGYQVRIKNINFLNQYKYISGNISFFDLVTTEDDSMQSAFIKEKCTVLLSMIMNHQVHLKSFLKFGANLSENLSSNIQVGVTKVFLLEDDHSILEKCLQRSVNAIRTLHSFGYKAIVLIRKKKRIIRRNKMATVIQALVRRRLFRNKYLKTLFSFKTIQIRFKYLYQQHLKELKLFCTSSVSLSVDDSNDIAATTEFNKSHSEFETSMIKLDGLSPHVDKVIEPIVKWKFHYDHSSSLQHYNNQITLITSEVTKLLENNSEYQIEEKGTVEMASNNNLAVFDLLVEKERLFKCINKLSDSVLKKKLIKCFDTIDYADNSISDRNLVAESLGDIFKSANHKKKTSLSSRSYSSILINFANKVVDHKHPLFNKIITTIEKIKSIVLFSIKEKDKMLLAHKNNAKSNWFSSLFSKTQDEKYVAMFLDKKKYSPIVLIDSIISHLNVIIDYYINYIELFIKEFGSKSVFRKSFKEDKAYLIALSNLIIENKRKQEIFKNVTSESPKKVAPKIIREKSFLDVEDDLQTKNQNNEITLTCYDSIGIKLLSKNVYAEIGIDSLYNLLTNSFFTPLLLLESSRKLHYQASTKYNSINLNSISSTHNNLDRINYKDISGILMTTIITAISHIDPTNILLDRDTIDNLSLSNIKGFSFDGISINNVFSFNKFKSEYSDTRTKDNILFLLPQMDTIIDNEIRDHLIQSTSIPEIIICNWLKHLNIQLSMNNLTNKSFKDLNVTNIISKSIMLTLYDNLKVLCSELKKNPDLTHSQLFEILYPRKAKSYQKLRCDFISNNNNGKITYTDIRNLYNNNSNKTLGVSPIKDDLKVKVMRDLDDLNNSHNKNNEKNDFDEFFQFYDDIEINDLTRHEHNKSIITNNNNDSPLRLRDLINPHSESDTTFDNNKNVTNNTDVTIIELLTYFVDTIDFNELANNCEETCYQIGKCCYFLPTIKFKNITESQLLSFYRDWLLYQMSDLSIANSDDFPKLLTKIIIIQNSDQIKSLSSNLISDFKAIGIEIKVTINYTKAINQYLSSSSSSIDINEFGKMKTFTNYLNSKNNKPVNNDITNTDSLSYSTDSASKIPPIVTSSGSSDSSIKNKKIDNNNINNNSNNNIEYTIDDDSTQYVESCYFDVSNIRRNIMLNSTKKTINNNNNNKLKDNIKTNNYDNLILLTEI